MGMYSENRAEYAIVQLACISDSITIVPINAKHTDLICAQNILEYTNLQTVCVSRWTLPQLL